MIFERSPEGVANRALFFDVDYVAYHESSKEDSLDCYFWQQIFRFFYLKRRFVFCLAEARPRLLRDTRHI